MRQEVERLLKLEIVEESNSPSRAQFFVVNGHKETAGSQWHSGPPYPTPSTVPQLRRLVGFFAHCAKWVKDYSSRVKALPDALQNKWLPLEPVRVQAISEVKTVIVNSFLASTVK